MHGCNYVARKGTPGEGAPLRGPEATASMRLLRDHQLLPELGAVAVEPADRGVAVVVGKIYVEGVGVLFLEVGCYASCELGGAGIAAGDLDGELFEETGVDIGERELGVALDECGRLVLWDFDAGVGLQVGSVDRVFENWVLA